MLSHHIGLYDIHISTKSDPINSILSDRYRISMPLQNHGIDTIICEDYLWYQLVNADALISSCMTIGVAWSDCNLIAILWTQYYAVCHAGWRWLTSGIIQSVLDRLLLLWESSSSLFVYLWPSIRWCCFEIWKDIAWLWWSHMTTVWDKYYADMITYIINILDRYHIISDHIVDIWTCTKCHPALWRSYRNGDTHNQALRITKN